jgi:Cof subfamily protein (haloacid dehalogenase superfamily)
MGFAVAVVCPLLLGLLRGTSTGGRTLRSGAEPVVLPRAIVLDADGTLLNRAHCLSPKVERAIRSAQDAGVLVMPATGRARSGPWVDEVLNPLFDNSPRGVFLQGLIVCDGQRCVLDSRLEPQIGQRVVKVCDEPTKALVAAYCNERLYFPAGFEDDDRVKRYASYGEAQPEPLEEAEMRDALETANKLLVLASEAELPRLRSRLESALRFRPARIVKALDWTLEVLPRGGSKGYGVARLLEAINVNPKHVMAVGDGENDIEMMRLVGCAVAMGNATPKLKRVAKHHVSSNENDGVAEAIERALSGDFVF